jgi:site-specific recombinase XerD
MLLSLGVAIEVVSEILGRADIRTTQIYAKVLTEQVKTG